MTGKTSRLMLSARKYRVNLTCTEQSNYIIKITFAYTLATEWAASFLRVAGRIRSSSRECTT